MEQERLKMTVNQKALETSLSHVFRGQEPPNTLAWRRLASCLGPACDTDPAAEWNLPTQEKVERGLDPSSSSATLKHHREVGAVRTTSYSIPSVKCRAFLFI
ncbi:hypothetical protein AV530_000315 [Patagioenas fasciata monilis]|uniref:Uncharacterized protein n=1 Tax=Patagioenas fasciata monilis TaxID=372326 RepID=A0A1V4KDI4_PATFA|nr:hypothetical protein AV530_000315 [Patagioenas fasciata monilis]